MYGVKEASTKLGVSEGHIRTLLQQGEIQGKKLGHDWVVTALNYGRKESLGGKK